MSFRDTPAYASFQHTLTRAKSSGRVRVLIGVALVVITTLLFPSETSHQFTYPEGSIWNDEDLIARFSFPVYRSTQAIERDSVLVMDSVPNSFDRMERSLAAVHDSIVRRFSILERILGAASASVTSDVRQSVLIDSAISIAFRTTPSVDMDSRQWSGAFSMFVNPANLSIRHDAITRAVNLISQAVSSTYRTGVLDTLKSELSQTDLAIRNRNEESLRPVADFLDKNDLPDYYRRWFASQASLSADQIELYSTLATQMTVPNVIFNHENTRTVIRSALERIPRTTGLVHQNERIIGRHERVTRDIIEKLDSYQSERTNRMGDVDYVLQAAGKIGYSAAILFLLAIFLFQFRKEVYNNNTLLLVISIIIVIMELLAHLSISLPVTGPLQYLILVPIASMLLTIMFDSRLAFYGTVVVSLLVAALRGNDFSIMVASVLGGSMALYTVRDIKLRTQIFRSLVFIFIGYAFAILVDGLQRSLDIGTISTHMLYALVNAIISPVLTYGLLIFFERVFNVTTDLTLLELSDFNHPLLRLLSERAPGTFHHSIVMGTMAETAAQSIGANAILARVGAYYHDIGKIQAPEFFVENQMGGRNIHENLKPRESAKIILDHVNQGLELGRKYRLPERVLEFIPAHHGSTIVSFFYEMERANNPDARQQDFQYPGPRPQSKEAGIVMLADSAEAAARVIEDPTRDKLEKLIDSLVRKRMADGELGICMLTLHDLEEIKKGFLNILLGIHHSRIKYPTEEEAQAAAKIAERTAKLLQMPTGTELLTRRLKKLNPFE
jgi:putative nucleotidyltransferase with HDIG domain